MASEAEKTTSQAGARRARRRTAEATATPAPAAKPGRRRLGRGAQVEAEETAVVVGKGRATPSRRHAEEEEEQARGGNAVSRFIFGMREYFEGVGTEVRKTTWPSREDTLRLSAIVLGTLVAMALALGAIALLFTELFRLGLSNPILLIGFMVLAVGGGLIFARVSARRASL